MNGKVFTWEGGLGTSVKSELGLAGLERGHGVLQRRERSDKVRFYQAPCKESSGGKAKAAGLE